MTPRRIISLPAALLALTVASACLAEPRSDIWRARLEGASGDIPFQLCLCVNDSSRIAHVHNGRETLSFPIIRLDADSVIIDMQPFPALLRGAMSEDGRRIEGVWLRHMWIDEWIEMPFVAEWQSSGASDCVTGRSSMSERSGAVVPRFTSTADSDRVVTRSVTGRWSVGFDGEPDRSVALFEQDSTGIVHGSFLTAAGDFRFVDGDFEDGNLRLATFDGSHAYLFQAELQENGELAGEFLSYGRFLVGWTARLDPEVTLSDPLGLGRWKETVRLADVVYPDVDGQSQSLAGPGVSGRVRLVMLGGSWCPNCGDASEFMSELDDRYRDQGLSLMGIMFELNHDFPANAQQVRRYAQTWDISYPLLVGKAGAKSMSESFPPLAPLSAIPSFLFIDRKDVVRYVYTGFSGPATGAEYTKLRDRFESIIRGLLGED